jgi:hypothetical protein
MPGKSAGRHCTLAFVLQLRRKRGKNLSQISRKVPFGHHSLRRHGHLLTRSPEKSADHGLPMAAW